MAASDSNAIKTLRLRTDHEIEFLCDFERFVKGLDPRNTHLRGTGVVNFVEKRSGRDPKSDVNTLVIHIGSWPLISIFEALVKKFPTARLEQRPSLPHEVVFVIQTPNYSYQIIPQSNSVIVDVPDMKMRTLCTENVGVDHVVVIFEIDDGTTTQKPETKVEPDRRERLLEVLLRRFEETCDPSFAEAIFKITKTDDVYLTKLFNSLLNCLEKTTNVQALEELIVAFCEQ